jgi:hypothetical protein
MTSLPRVNVVNALLAEWRDTRVPLSRHRLHQADQNTKEDLELYLNYVEMLKAEGVTLESDMEELLVGTEVVVPCNTPSKSDVPKDFASDTTLPELIKSAYPKYILEAEYGIPSSNSLDSSIARSKVSFSTLLKSKLTRAEASARLSWVNRLAVDFPSKDGAYLCVLISGDIYSAMGGIYMTTAEVFYGMAYSMARSVDQRALILSRMTIVMLKLKSIERLWLGRTLATLAESTLAGCADYDDRVASRADILMTIRASNENRTPSNQVYEAIKGSRYHSDLDDRVVLETTLPPLGNLDARKFESIEAALQGLEVFQPETLKFYQKRFIASYLCLSSFIHHGFESGSAFAKLNHGVLNVNPVSFDFLFTHCSQYASLLADEGSAKDLKQIGSRPPERLSPVG